MQKITKNDVSIYGYDLTINLGMGTAAFKHEYDFYNHSTPTEGFTVVNSASVFNRQYHLVQYVKEGAQKEPAGGIAILGMGSNVDILTNPEGFQTRVVVSGWVKIIPHYKRFSDNQRFNSQGAWDEFSLDLSIIAIGH